MCLQLNTASGVPIEQQKPQTTQKVYKLYRRADGTKLESFDTYGLTVKQVYRHREICLKKGKQIRSTRPFVCLTANESLTCRVKQGFHVYTNLQVAKDRAVSIYNTYVVIEFDAKPENFVANGTFQGHGSAVYTKLTPTAVISF